jgi:hypothetical protein
MVPYKETGTFIARGSDDVIALLDDQIVKVLTSSHGWMGFQTSPGTTF